jgi:hypothetical protein
MAMKRRTVACYFLIVALTVSACGPRASFPPPSSCATPGPSATPCGAESGAPSESAPATASSTPGVETRPAEIVSRITLPYPGESTPEPWPQTPEREHVVVTADALWIIVNFQHLVRVDLASNQVSAVESVAFPVRPSFGGAGLWLYGPTDAAPITRSRLIRVDQASGALSSFPWGELVDRMAVGRDGVWVIRSQRLYKLDPRTTDELGSVPTSAWNFRTGCGELWVIDDDADGNEFMLRIDQETLQVAGRLDVVGQPVASEGRCWLFGDGLFELTDETLSSVTSSPLINAADSFWVELGSNRIQRYDPVAAAPTGPRWQLDSDDLRPSVKGESDWLLVSAGGSLWLLNRDQLIRYDIPTVP